jgi:hypothetical protein
MLDTQLYTVAAGPCHSGDLSVPDPSPAQAQEVILAHTLSFVGQSGEYVSSLNYQFDVDSHHVETLDPRLYGFHVWDKGLGCKRQGTLEEWQRSRKVMEEQRRRLAQERAALAETPPKAVPPLLPEQLAEIEAWRPSEEAAKDFFKKYPV